MNVSKESQDFLENLRLYLFSSGKNEQEIEGIISELEDHLHEAEQHGKNVEDIIGDTPKNYMKQISSEMELDLMGALKYLSIIFFGAFTYILIGDVIDGGITFSVLELIGYPFIFLILILGTAISFKYIASRKRNKLSKIKEWLLFGLLGLVPILSFMALIYFDRIYHTPTIAFGAAVNITAVIVSILVYIGIAIWSKTWVPIVIPIALFLPEILINMTNFNEDTKLILTGIIPMLCVAVAILILLKLESKRDKRSENSFIK